MTASLWGFVGVLIFSLTLPATKLTVGSLDPWFVGLGRTGISALLALVVLAATRTPLLPPRKSLGSIVLIGLGVSVGFPVFTALALQTVPASHSAVILGILPLVTAVAGAVLAHERHRPRFWYASVVGAALVVAFAVWRNGFALSGGDVFLFLAVVSASVGYARGGVLARELGGWKVISWTVILMSPVALVAAWLTWPPSLAAVKPEAWAGFAYTGVFSMFLGFFAWYHGLARGGIGKVGQWQLLQPFLTFGFATWMLGEALDLATVSAAVVVVAAIFWGRWPERRP